VRLFVLQLTLLAALLAAPLVGLAQSAEWQAFVQRHLAPDGRVVDDGSGGISHSEGQGMTMLLAVHHGDRGAFEKIHGWTRANLAVRDDGLLAWRWEPSKGITDRNNATDGDLFVAWALARAAGRWGEETYRTEATERARAVRTRLARSTAWGVVLLPGAEGFEKPDHRVVNLSYWIFPAFRELNAVDPDPAWAELERSGLRLLELARFGHWGLPPDWLRLADPLKPAQDYPARFGYDAVRIPLYLIWARLGNEARLAPFKAFWSHFDGARFLSPWTDLGNDSVDPRDAIPGIHAIAHATRATGAVTAYVFEPPQSFYSGALVLLTQLMQWEQRAP
jgi:endoglucanase